MNIYKEQSKNVRKTWLIMAGFFIFIVILGYVFSYVYSSPGILFFAVIFSVVMNFFSFWYSDKIVLAMSGARPVTREAFPDLWNITENLSITAGIPMPKLYVIEDSAPNAFATGRNKENAAVAVTTGLLQTLERTELEGVIAHELAHIGNRDILLQTIVVMLVGFITLLSDFFLRMTMFGGGRRSEKGGGNAQLIMMLVGIVLAILSPIAALLIQLAISRKREFLADAAGSLLTRYPEGLASALEKIHAHAYPMKRANHATAHLYISDPFEDTEKKKIGFLTKLFQTHPPVEERVKVLRGMK